MYDKEIEEITQLISELTLMKKEIKHNKIIDSNKILKKYETYTESDSGIDSEPIQESSENFILPAYNLQEIIFESSDFDQVLKNLFKYVWQCLQQAVSDLAKNAKILQTILDCIKDFIIFLNDSKNDYFREIIVKKNLDALYAKAMEHTTDDLFNFVMEIFIKLGAVKELYNCIFYLIIEKIKAFADKVNLEKPSGGFLFKHETEFSRINTLIITGEILKTENLDNDDTQREPENKHDVCYILQTFVRHDFYVLEYMSKKLFSI